MHYINIELFPIWGILVIPVSHISNDDEDAYKSINIRASQEDNKVNMMSRVPSNGGWANAIQWLSFVIV